MAVIYIQIERMVNMKDFQNRVIKEKEELDIKIRSLISFVNSGVFKGIVFEEQQLLKMQLTIMQDYSDILTKRIAAFTPFFVQPK